MKACGNSYEGVDGEITYTLTEEDVMKWGQPSNQYVLPVTREAFLEKMKKCGYEALWEKSKEEYLVIDKKYGIFKSLFHKKEDFRLGESLGMRLISDPVSGKVTTVGIYSERGNLQETAACAAEAVGIVSEDAVENREELEAVFLKQLEDYRREMKENPGNSIYAAAACADCICAFTDVDGRYYIIISRTDDVVTLHKGQPGTAPYFWQASTGG